MEARRKCIRGNGTKFMVISFRSKFSDPSNRMELVRLFSKWATKEFMRSKGRSCPTGRLKWAKTITTAADFRHSTCEAVWAHRYPECRSILKRNHYETAINSQVAQSPQNAAQRQGRRSLQEACSCHGCEVPPSTGPVENCLPMAVQTSL